MLDTQPTPRPLDELLKILDAQHEELSDALDRGAIADARRLQAEVLQTARSIDQASRLSGRLQDQNRMR